MSDDEREEKNQLETEQNDFNIGPLLMIQNPVRVKTKGQPPSALNKERTAQEAEFENVTCRKLSRFEYEDANERIRLQERGV